MVRHETDQHSYSKAQIYNSVLLYLIRNSTEYLKHFPPHEKMMVTNSPPRSGYRGPFPVLGTPQIILDGLIEEFKIVNSGLIEAESMNRAPDDKFPAWIRFLSIHPKCSSWCCPTETTNSLPESPEFLARCSFLIFLKFLLSAVPVARR